MKIWAILGIMAVIVLAASLVIAKITVDENVTAPKSSCESCGNSCTAENNCGLSTCKAVSENKTCGCRR